MIGSQFFSGPMSLNWVIVTSIYLWIFSKYKLKQNKTKQNKTKQKLPSTPSPGFSFPSLFPWNPYSFWLCSLFSPLGEVGSIEVAGTLCQLIQGSGKVCTGEQICVKVKPLCISGDGYSSPSPAKGFPGGSDRKNLPAVWETWVQSLGQEYPLEKVMAIHSSIPAWWIPWTEEPGEIQSTGLQSQTRLRN